MRGSGLDADVNLPDEQAVRDTRSLPLVIKAAGRVDGFVVEGPTAGGHDAAQRSPERSR